MLPEAVLAQPQLALTPCPAALRCRAQSVVLCAGAARGCCLADPARAAPLGLWQTLFLGFIAMASRNRSPKKAQEHLPPPAKKPRELSSKFADARAQLHLSAMPKRLICREKEQVTLRTFLLDAINSGEGSTLCTVLSMRRSGFARRT